MYITKPNWCVFEISDKFSKIKLLPRIIPHWKRCNIHFWNNYKYLLKDYSFPYYTPKLINVSNDKIINILEYISQNPLPIEPGVYFFKNKNDKIIYIGKAKVLRNRVKSYFRKSSSLDNKTKVMVKHIAKVEWLVVRDEIEALLTEANLIKEHQPRYNILLKDDKTFPYICITNEPYPRVEIVRASGIQSLVNNTVEPKK